MQALAVLLALMLIAGPALAQGAAGKVAIHVTGAATANDSTSTGEVTSPTPVIAPEPLADIAVPLITRQQAEQKNELAELVRSVWNFFFGFVLKL